MKLRNLWWFFLIRGILLLWFGFFAIGYTGLTFVSLTYAFAFYIVFSGIVTIMHSITGRTTHSHWLLTLILGLFEIAVGLFALRNPVINILVIILLIGITFVIRGIVEILSSFDKAYDAGHKVLLVIAGTLAIIAGIFILRYPVTGTLTFTWVLGVYAFVGGALLVVLSFTIRNLTLVTPAKRRLLRK